MRYAHFQILHVIDKAIQAPLNSREARLNLLKQRHDDVSDFAHGECILVPEMFCKHDI